jgi:hypothetical protein
LNHAGRFRMFPFAGPAVRGSNGARPGQQR